MINIIEPILAELDPSVVYIVCALLVVLIIITVIKKAVKFTITIAILCICVFMLAPAAKKFQNDYKFKVDGTKLQMMIGSEYYSIENPDNIENVKIMFDGTGGLDIKIQYKDAIQKFNAPKFMLDAITGYLDSNEVEYDIQE